MELMLPFSEYCEISNVIYKKRHYFIKQDKGTITSPLDLVEHNLTLLQAKAMFIVDPTHTSTIINLINQCNPEMIDELMRYFDESAPIQKLLDSRLQELNKTKQEKFTVEVHEKKNMYPVYDVLIDEMNIKGYKTDAELYKYIDMDRRVFGKFRKKNASISREYAFWFAVGFELDYPEAVEFLAKFGYAFKKTDDRESLIAYVMRTRVYKFREMQSILFSYGFRIFGERK